MLYLEAISAAELAAAQRDIRLTLVGAIVILIYAGFCHHFRNKHN